MWVLRWRLRTGRERILDRIPESLLDGGSETYCHLGAKNADTDLPLVEAHALGPLPHPPIVQVFRSTPFHPSLQGL